MIKFRNSFAALGFFLALLTFAPPAHAQKPSPPPKEVNVVDTPSVGEAPSASATVLASPAGDGLRFTAPGQISQIGLAVYDSEGSLVFDSGLRKGSVFDWKTTDAAQAMADGSYLFVVTFKDFRGKLSQRLGGISLQAARATLKRARGEELTAAQSQALAGARQSQKIEAAESFDPVTVVTEGKERAITVATHDGENGQVTSTSGALTFRTGDIVSGKDTEQMRVTPEGRVGIGTHKPEATLDVAGTVTARGGIVFPDGTKLTTAAAAGGGNSMTGSQIVTAINDPATVGVINDARLSPGLARLGAVNAWSGPNTFTLGLSANNAPVTNVGNPVNPADAANKGYVESNFVKFVPGAEQLSIGDANGTATMINLRGGSTCCSGPGGHTPAFFKVFQNGSFVATGNLGIGVSPMEGQGYRTSWHTYKGAFRSGYADNEWNDANTGFFSWSGGSNSTASGLYSFSFGDTNFARSTSSIAFGSGNEVKGAAGFAAGAGNRVCDTYGVALGNNARSGGPFIDGKCDPETFNITGLAAVALGYNVTASKDHSFAFGKYASNNGFSGTFVWADGAAQASADTFKNTANNEVAFRASGGFRFRTNLAGTTGCNLPAGSGVFNCTSSRTTKENFAGVNGEDVLARLRKIPVSTWNYISEGQQVRHLGPMAEDFHHAFNLGTSNTSIGVQDLTGVSLAAVKALELRTSNLQAGNEQLEARLEQKTAEVVRLRSQLSAIEKRLAALEQRKRDEGRGEVHGKGRRQ